MPKRFDILVYNSQHQPWMMVECKAMNIDLKEEVLNQVLRYNITVPVQYLVITNGTYCMAFKKAKHTIGAIGRVSCIRKLIERLLPTEIFQALHSLQQLYQLPLHKPQFSYRECLGFYAIGP